MDRGEEWVKKNRMELAMHECTKTTFRGSHRNFNIMDQKLDHPNLKDLGIHVSDNLIWKIHIEERLRKANKVLYFLRSNVAVTVDTCETRTVQVSHLASPVVWFLMCLCMKSRSPPTRKFPEGSEMDNRESDNELSKPTENPEHHAATNVSTVERYTAFTENHARRNGNQHRPTRETRNKRKKK